MRGGGEYVYMLEWGYFLSKHEGVVIIFELPAKFSDTTQPILKNHSLI